MTDITYIGTPEGWLCLAVSCQVVRWSMGCCNGDCPGAQCVADGPVAQPAKGIGHRALGSGSQFTGYDCQDFLPDQNRVRSMSRRGTWPGSGDAERFFQLLKRERIRRRIHLTCDQATVDVFNDIEMFDMPTQRHGTAGDVSPLGFERRHFQRLLRV